MSTPNEMNSFTACGRIEGFSDEENLTALDMAEAWAYLIATKQAFTLQGFYGRQAMYFIEQGLISEEGEIQESFHDLIAEAEETDLH